MPRKNQDNRSAERLEKFRQILQRKAAMLIVTQDHPDPDAIGAAVALRKVVNTLAKVPCSIAHGGTVGRAENRALVRYLGLNLRPCRELDFSKFDLIAMVDTQPGTGNNPLPEDYAPDIVFDHHPARKASREVPFADIRPRYGATVTILLEYLRAAGITPDPPLATAMLYAIRSDTQDLGREACQADVDAMAYLLGLANWRMLSGIQRGSLPRTYFLLLDEGLKNACFYGPALVTTLGEVDNPDMIAEIADLLLREDETTWTMCMGIFEGTLRISLRTRQEGARADRIIRRIVARRGTGGGHALYAGGQIPLADRPKTKRARLMDTLRARFLKAIGQDARSAQKLLAPRPDKMDGPS
ncbi:MAG TPA: phosphoesterase [Phycisphaerales bacterium]|nr:phosphoesterase [Phycisphaerales bacterium]